MARIEIMVGGSGKWAAYYPQVRHGQKLASGKTRGGLDAIARELEHQAAGQPDPQYFLKGGQLFDLDISESNLDSLLSRSH